VSVPMCRCGHRKEDHDLEALLEYCLFEACFCQGYGEGPPDKIRPVKEKQ